MLVTVEAVATVGLILLGEAVAYERLDEFIDLSVSRMRTKAHRVAQKLNLRASQANHVRTRKSTKNMAARTPANATKSTGDAEH